MFFTGSSKLKNWTVPDILAEVSLGHLHADNVSPELRSSAVENYLLISIDGAVTILHTDFSQTSVMYIVLTGCKEFYIVPESAQNQQIFSEFKKKTANKR